MLFNSLQFAVFFFIVYILYLRFSHKWQNKMLLVASYIFYGAWDWRFLSLIFISTLLDYFCGIKIEKASVTRSKKLFLILSVVGNLSILGFFKYFDFFAVNFQSLVNYFGFSVHPRLLKIILPVGISFYTFQTMSYTIDIYREQLKPTRNFLDFALFVSFFPQLVAGPIERARNLLPQILSPRQVTLDNFYQGCYLIFWGLFQKIFVADNLAKIVDPIFAGRQPYDGTQVLLGIYAFAFQIFCDFAAYSNIARGLGKVMGFDIMVNFNLPYFSPNPREFWQRWHISLSTWLRDYLYIPLGGNRKGNLKTYRNLAITMLLGGLWHGAAWTFVIWGAYQALLLIIHRLLTPFFQRVSLFKKKSLKKLWFFIKVISFFHLTCLGWLIFRAENIKQALDMAKGLFFNFHLPLSREAIFIFSRLGSFLWILIIVQIFQFKNNDLMAILRLNAVWRWMFYFLCFSLLLQFVGESAQQFIYFQF